MEGIYKLYHIYLIQVIYLCLIGSCPINVRVYTTLDLYDTPLDIVCVDWSSVCYSVLLFLGC